jgi:hypothetical protein
MRDFVATPSGLPNLIFKGQVLKKYYVCTTTGRIFNWKRQMGCISNAGYEMIYIIPTKKDGFPHLTHRLIWEHCNGAIPDDKIIDHIDDNKLNNSISNLQLITKKENSKKSYANGKRQGMRHPPKAVVITHIESGVETKYPSLGKAANAMGVHSFCLTSVLQKKTKYVWRDQQNHWSVRLYSLEEQNHDKAVELQSLLVQSALERRI